MSKSPLASMTGFARAAGSAEGCSFQIEVKSVNARGLDLRLRLAPGLEGFEPELRRRLSDKLTRGSVSISASLRRETGGGELVINPQALETALSALSALRDRVPDAPPPRIETILGLRGVLEQQEPALTPEAEAELEQSFLETFDACLTELVASRRREGGELGAILSARLDEIAGLTEQAERHPSRSREAVLERLRQQIADLSEAGQGLSEERLHQEAMLLATKADIREELDRLKAHVAAARDLLAKGGPVGRKLDFLSQEFNREANTLCSKSNAVELTAIGLDLKHVIDQLARAGSEPRIALGAKERAGR